MIERRTYNTPATALFGACLSALGLLRAEITGQNIEAGTIAATLGAGRRATAGTLLLTIRPAGAGTSELSAEWQPNRRGGRGSLAALFELIDTLLSPA